MTKSLKQIQQENRKFILEATLIGNNLRLLKENNVEMRQSGRIFIGGKKVADKKWRDKNKERLYLIPLFF